MKKVMKAEPEDEGIADQDQMDTDQDSTMQADMDDMDLETLEQFESILHNDEEDQDDEGKGSSRP